MRNAVDGVYTACGCVLGTLIVLLVVALGLGVAFGVFCFEGWIFMLLWNWLAVDLLGAKVLGYWVCVGIVFLLNFLGKLIFGRTSVTVKSNS